MSMETYVGENCIRFEPPDICFVVYGGDLSEAEAIGINAEIRKVAEGKGHTFLLCDLTNMGDVSTEVRKTSAETLRMVNFRGIAVYGASFHLRVIAMLVAKLINVKAASADNPIRFFSTGAEARAWLDERRRAVLSSRKLSSGAEGVA
jgi:hypothetical protein